MHMPIRDINDFIPADNADVISNARISHKVCRGMLRGIADKVWIRKEMDTPFIAQSEVLAQEFFRLLLPHQPETLLVSDSTTDTHFILSEEVGGYRNLPTNEACNFANGTYNGLGQVMLCSMFLQEIDLKNGNLGLDLHGRVIKIDGDWCFAAARVPQKKYALTADAINALPYPTDFYTFNWLDLVMENIRYPTGNIIDATLSQAVQFRSEVNQAILKIFLLPEVFIDKFVDAYIPAGGERFAELIKTRCEELRVSALLNPSFNAYMNTQQAAVDTQGIIDQMRQFKVRGEDFLTSDVSDGFQDEVRATAEKVRLSIECSQLLREIKGRCVKKDKLLSNYIIEKEVNLSNKNVTSNELLELKKGLSKTLAALNSPEVLVVNKAIKNLRDGAVWYRFAIGKGKKADSIEKALYEIPGESRADILGLSSLTAALNSNRLLVKRDTTKTYKKALKDISTAPVKTAVEDEVPDASAEQLPKHS